MRFIGSTCAYPNGAGLTRTHVRTRMCTYTYMFIRCIQMGWTRSNGVGIVSITKCTEHMREGSLKHDYTSRKRKSLVRVIILCTYRNDNILCIYIFFSASRSVTFIFIVTLFGSCDNNFTERFFFFCKHTPRRHVRPLAIDHAKILENIKICNIQAETVFRKRRSPSTVS